MSSRPSARSIKLPSAKATSEMFFSRGNRYHRQAMKSQYSSLLLLAALAGPLSGAASADDTPAKSAAVKPTASKDAPPSDASIRELMRVSNAQKLLESVKGQVDAMTDMTIQQAAHGTPLSPQKQAIIDDMRTRMMAAFDETMRWDKLEPIYMHAYRDSFTQSELDGIIRFYKTPSGQAMVSKLPAGHEDRHDRHAGHAAAHAGQDSADCARVSGEAEGRGCGPARFAMRRASIRVIPRKSFKAVPWKNGGGVTYEAVRVPASGDPFDWRVSVARVEASGPFSDFADHDRKMVLLEGRGLMLRFGNGTTTSLSAVGELAQFDGAMPTYGELIDGPCVDLNLMVLKGTRASAQVLRVSRHDIDAFGGTALLFPMDRAAMVVTAEGESASLEPGDLAILSDGAARLETPDDAAASLFVALLGRR